MADIGTAPCARRAAASGRSARHGARMPSLQDRETVPENSQLQSPRILLHHDPDCSGLRLEVHPAADQECGEFSKTPRHRTSESFVAAAASSFGTWQHRAGDHGRLWSRCPSAVQEPATNLPSPQLPTLTHDSSAVQDVCRDNLASLFMVYNECPD